MGSSLTVTSHLQDTVQFTGEEVILTCEVSVGGAASARWYHGDKELKNSDKVSMIQKGKVFELRVSNVQECHGGYYRIKVKHSSKVLESAAKVTVQEKLAVTRPCMDVNVYGGQEVILTCEVNRKDVTAKWTKGDQLLSEGRGFVTEQRGRRFTLKIRNAQKLDNGVYTCLVTSGHEEVRCSAEVRVQEFEKEWRNIKFDDQTRRKFQSELCRLKPNVDSLRILLYGPAGSGKSSFINSINNIFTGRPTTVALADAVGAGTSFTKRFKTHRIQISEKPEYLSVVFNDVMGLEDDLPESQGHRGVHPEDIVNILHGRVQENYEFQPSVPLQREAFNRDPKPGDKVHCLVCVLPADRISLMTDNVFRKMRRIREKASDMGIPQAVMMTTVDQACPVVKSDLGKIYCSMKIKEKMQDCSNKLGVTMNYIFPVKNYHEEKDLVLEMDVLILDALLQIVRFADDYMRNKQVT